MTAAAPREKLAHALGVLANPTRLAILDRLAEPRYAPELESDLGLTRQSVKRHLDLLVESGLVDARPGRRGIFSAIEYVASPVALFALQEDVLMLAAPARRRAGSHPTLPAAPHSRPLAAARPGLLVLHGARRGEWLPLAGERPSCAGRDAGNDVPLVWDPFASARHALLERRAGTWHVTDLRAKNGTFVDFEPMAPGSTVAVGDGTVLGIGRTLLLLRT